MGRINKASTTCSLLFLVAVLHSAYHPLQAQQSQEGTNIKSLAEPFLKANCIRCHGPAAAKSDLRIDQLSTDLSDPSTFKVWQKILSRIESGEMPPEKEPRPAPNDLVEVVEQLSIRLNAAAAKHNEEGRTILRRLNRIEYENTVRDLFDINVSVKEMLPEDAVSRGFDNVGAALNVSPVLIERYLDAADAVLDAAVAPVHKLESTTQKFDLYDSLPKWFVAGVWKREDGVILYRNGGDSASDLREFKAPAPGRYRFRIAASAHNSETPLPMAVLLGNFVVSGNPTRHLGYFDATPGQPNLIEFEERLAARNDTVKVTPVALPFVYLKHETMPDYPGPGLQIHSIEVSGPAPEAWPTESFRRVFGDVDPKNGKLADAERLLRELLPKAFRRPITETPLDQDEVQPFVSLVAKALDIGLPFNEALRTGIKAVLTSPKFLYLREPTGPLDDYALASRLSYFLWSSMPDETLVALAQSGNLHQSEVLYDQVERMLSHPKAKAFTENFTGQWLSLRDINATTPDKTMYPEHEEFLQWSSVQETHLFFDALLKENLSVGNFVDSDFAMLNGRLAQHYGIPNVHGVAFRRVPLKPENHRGGVLTHASILKVTANGSTTSPVLRGVWVLDRILGMTVPPPPPNIPAVEPDIRGATTIREHLAKHRTNENCAGCHSRIDPLGFALENYDVIGGWRERYRVVADRKDWVNNRIGPLAKYLAAYQYGEGKQIETGDTLPDGRPFSDLTELKQLLLAHPDVIARCVTEKLVTYATGQPVEFADAQAVNQIINQAKDSNYGLRSIIHAVVASELFRTK